jgi:hypothetical protein
MARNVLAVTVLDSSCGECLKKATNLNLVINKAQARVYPEF